MYVCVGVCYLVKLLVLRASHTRCERVCVLIGYGVDSVCMCVWVFVTS